MMDARSIPDADVVALVREHGGIRPAVRATGMHYNTVWTKYHRGLEAEQDQERKPRVRIQARRAEIEIPNLPSDHLPVDELIERRKRQFRQKSIAREARHLIPVTVRIDGPFGIAHGGDPHVDDDGTDIAKIERDAEIVQRTEGLFYGNVGDTRNNWIGRLARLYGEQSTSAAESLQLAEWYLGLLRGVILYLVAGNHDCWSGTDDPLRWIMGQAGGIYEPNGARLNLQAPNGREFRINARHDFKGHSQWNTAHGPAKAAQMGWRDHVLTCGHLHTSGYQVLKDPATGLISHALRVASYKTYDRYADQLGLPDQNIFTCPVTILDPQYADDDPRCITTIFDAEEGAAYLTWKRAKWKQGRRAA